MCFFIDPEHKRVKIAKKDMVCYKRLHIHSFIGGFRSPYADFIYEKGETYFEDSMSISNDDFFDRIEVGLHSYSKKSTADGHWQSCVTVRCVIPKGSRYYYNERTKEYVSDTLRIGKKPLK